MILDNLGSLKVTHLCRSQNFLLTRALLNLLRKDLGRSKPAIFTVKKAGKLLDAPSKNTFLKSNKYNSIVEIVYLDTHVFFSPLCYRMRKFDIREVQ
jgi:hypothetical protein